MYHDIGLMIGHHRARVAMEHVVGMCTQFDTEIFYRINKISDSPYINPDNVAGVDGCVTALGIEVLKTMKEYQCFEHNQPAQAWEFIEVLSGRLVLKPPTKAIALEHPLLAHWVPT